MYVNSDKFVNISKLQNTKSQITPERLRLEKQVSYYQGRVDAFIALNDLDNIHESLLMLKNASAKLEEALRLELSNG